MPQFPFRLAMWTCPRNISTAMMRSWGNRPDTAVCDEPLYAHYLHTTRRDHPGRDEVIAAGPTDINQAIDFLLGPVPGGKSIFYQKHMAQHLLPHINRGWMRRLTNCFLIRDPREMLTSFLKFLPDARPTDTGYPQQLELFSLVRGWTGSAPIVIDSHDVLDNPRKILALLCNRLEIPFTDRMLSWAPGPRSTDGVWAKYWYKEVETSTGFKPYKPKGEPVPDHMQDLLKLCIDCYDQMYPHRLGA